MKRKRKTKKKNKFLGSKPLALFVVVAIGVVLFAYVLMGMVSLEMQGNRIKVKAENFKRAKTFMMQQEREMKMQQEKLAAKSIGAVWGKVVSVGNNVVTVEADLGGNEFSQVQLFVDEEQAGEVNVGSQVRARLHTNISLAEASDGVHEVMEFSVE